MRRAEFSTRLLAWYDHHGRHDLPWQHPRTPYRVWVAEVMLQQTQVATAVPYFQRFMTQFPNLHALAAATLDEVLALWSGLGYYTRARNLHATACMLQNEGEPRWPQEVAGWMALPGIGRSTAAAILAQAFDRRQAILDGNVRRVLARHAGVRGWPGKPDVAQKLWALAEARLPDARFADYTQAQMDLGALLCRSRNPQCGDCPVSADCVARQEGLTQTLPTPRPKRARPQRKMQLLLIHDAGGRWLLQRRPPAGIWGGLWCPPLVADETTRKAECLRLGIGAGRWRRLAPVDHGFTHFRLRLQPRLRTVELPQRVADGDMDWVSLDRLRELGLPAPVRTIFDNLSS